MLSRTLVALLLAFVAALSSCGGTGPQRSGGDTSAANARPVPPARVVRAKAAAVLSTLLRTYARRDGGRDPQYFGGGVWHSADKRSWSYTNAGPGGAAAALWAAGYHDPLWRRLATRTFDTVIAQHQAPDGSFTSSDTQSGDVRTTFAASQLAWAYLDLGASLDGAHQRAWRTAIVRAADYELVRQKALSFYVNGNVNLAYIELFDLAWRVTHDEKYRTAANAEWSFTLHPPGARWKGFGLHVVRSAGTASAGYLAESGGGTPGFDAEYTMAQSDIASRIAVESGDRRAVRLMSLEANLLLPRIDRPAFVLSTASGTRHPQAGRTVPFTSPVLELLAWNYGDGALRAAAAPAFKALLHWSLDARGYSDVNRYRGLAAQLAPLLLVGRGAPVR